MSKNTEHFDDDVLVMFPTRARVSGPPKEEDTNPLPLLIEEMDESRREFDSSPLFDDPPELKSLFELTESLEVRLNVLEEVKSRLKFYLDDLENTLYVKK